MSEMPMTTLEVGPFTGLEVSDRFRVDVTIGSPEGVSLRVDDRLRDDVEIEVRGDLLRIGLRPGIHRAHEATLEAEVTAPAIDRVLAAGASTVRVASAVAGERLDLALSGSSSITAELATGVAHVTLSGSSMATLSGAASTVEATVSGASHLYADELAAVDLTIDVSGASTADVMAKRGSSRRARPAPHTCATRARLPSNDPRHLGPRASCRGSVTTGRARVGNPSTSGSSG